MITPLKNPFLYAALLASIAVVPVGCSSVKTRVDNGPIKAHTFSFVSIGSKAPASASNVAAIHATIQDAITRALASKGVSKLPSGGDVTVAYLLIAGDNVSTTSLNDYFGYNSDATALVDQIHKQQTIKDNDRNHFEAGTLVIDLVDPQTSKLLWRNSMQRDILRNVTTEARAERIQEVVDATLQTAQISP